MPAEGVAAVTASVDGLFVVGGGIDVTAEEHGGIGNELACLFGELVGCSVEAFGRFYVADDGVVDGLTEGDVAVLVVEGVGPWFCRDKRLLLHLWSQGVDSLAEEF